MKAAIRDVGDLERIRQSLSGDAEFALSQFVVNGTDRPDQPALLDVGMVVDVPALGSAAADAAGPLMMDEAAPLMMAFRFRLDQMFPAAAPMAFVRARPIQRVTI